jgi:large subunit ribosomal protein L23
MSIVLKPRMSEKTYGLSQSGIFVFVVDTNVNKHEVAEAVEKTYNVTVEKVRIVVQNGKSKRVYRNKRFVSGERSDIKKAYVTLKEGDSIPIFAAVEEQEAQAEKTQEKVTKAVEKKIKKDTKTSKKEEK